MAQFFIHIAIMVDLLLFRVFHCNKLYESLSYSTSYFSLAEQFHDVVINYDWNIS